MDKTPYFVRREDFDKPEAQAILKDAVIIMAGATWVLVAFTAGQLAEYPFPKTAYEGQQWVEFENAGKQ